MELVLLEENQRQFFDDNGYLIVANALTPQEVAQLTAASDRMIEAFERQQNQYYVQRRPGIVQETGGRPPQTVIGGAGRWFGRLGQETGHCTGVHRVDHAGLIGTTQDGLVNNHVNTLAAERNKRMKGIYCDYVN